MLRASLCPSSGEQDRVLRHMVFCTVCAGCGCVALGHTVHTACDPAPHNHSQHNQCRIPYAVTHSLVLLMMGIKMSETCLDRSLIINIGLVASCLFISLRPTFYDARSREPKTSKTSRNFVQVWNIVGPDKYQNIFPVCKVIRKDHEEIIWSYKNRWWLLEN